MTESQESSEQVATEQVAIEQVAPETRAPKRRVFRGGGPLSVAPMLSLVGLLIIGLLTFQVYRNWAPSLSSAASATPTATPVPLVSGQTATPAPPSPTDTIATNPQISVPGTLVYVKDGRLWVQSGTASHAITEPVDGSRVSQPAFSADGQWIYYIDTRVTSGRWYNPNDYGAVTRYTYYYPVLCRVHPDGSGQKDVLSSLIHQGKLLTFYWITQPSISSTGNTVAVVSDGPSVPGVQDPGIHYVSTTNGHIGAALPLRETSPLGLSDPAFSPDGTQLAYTMEGRSGKYGAPSIWIFKNGSAHKLANGYRAAAWSPDARYIAATKVSGDTLNVVVLDATSGRQVATVTSDDASWGPVWSPAGDELVYMHITGTVVDLNMVYISGSGADMTFKIEPHLTDYSGLDGASPAAWFVPGYGPTPTPSATPTATPTATP